jgi:hypothetical protein
MKRAYNYHQIIISIRVREDNERLSARVAGNAVRDSS